MVEVTKAKFLKWAIGAMVDVNMKLMPPKIIGREGYLWAKGLLRLLKDHGPKRCPNTWGNKESKEIKEFMNMGNGGVQCNRYDGCCA